MNTSRGLWFLPFLASLAMQVQAQTAQSVVDISTRPGVSQRMVVLSPPEPKAAVILLAGGRGGLRIFPNGSFGWGDNNFVVRTRQLFAGPDGPDGIVLTSSILTDTKSRPVPALPLATLRVPVLVVRHEQDGCSHCSFSEIPAPASLAFSQACAVPRPD